MELKALNEKVDLKEKRKVTAAYHERKLGIKEHPSTFLTDLKKIRNQLATMKGEIKEDDFFVDILGKFPQFDDV